MSNRPGSERSMPPGPPSVRVASLIGGRYRVLDELGRGGVATVYRVHDERDDRVLALKRLRVDHGDEKRTHHLNMLEREYRMLAQLEHPCVIGVYDYAADRREPYYTMELLDGEDLRKLAPLPWREACLLMRDACSSLSLLHSRRMVHRDVSPRNVRRTADGRAKLIDFGAMVPMGHCRTIVGTPPLVAPETLHGQDPDGRCDLFAIGGTLYWTLTGRHAYPARALSQLPDVWRQTPPAPSELVADVPRALDALVMSLLSLDPELRPRSAAEVMEHLSAIAGLPDDEQLAVTQSYLATPTLVGRAEAIASVRHAMIGALGSAGSVVWVGGDTGVGRSRFLDACALEARLLRARVVRAHAADPAGLFQALRAELDDSGQNDEALTRAATQHNASTRAAGHAALVRILARAAEQEPFVLAVDDVDRASEPARATLAAIAEAACDARILLIVTAPDDHRPCAALSLLREAASELRLEALPPAHVEELLRSVFGDPPELSALAQRIHALSRGNPAATMALAQHLVDTRQAHYALGGWRLPSEIDERDLPRSLAEALAGRIDSLGADARELAGAIALARPYGIGPEDYARLTGHGDAGRLQGALEELVAARVLQLEGEHYGFASQAFEGLLLAAMDSHERQSLSARLATTLGTHGRDGSARDGIDLARCALQAGDEVGAVDRLCAELARGTRWQDGPSDYAVLLREAAHACRKHERPCAQRLGILRELVRVGSDLSVAGIPDVLRELFERLAWDCGLRDYWSLPDSLAADARVARALDGARARHDGRRVEERWLEPTAALKELAQLVREAAAFASASLDLELLAELPDLSPFCALSPAIEQLVAHTLPACRALAQGRYEDAREHLEQVLSRLQQADRAGLDAEQAAWSIHALRFGLGHVHAGLGAVRALSFADELEQEADWVPSAWDVRRAFHLRQGNARGAENARRQIERLQLGRPQRPTIVGASARLELECHARADDLMGVKRARERLEALVALHPGFAPYRHYAEAEYERLRGHHEQALREITLALAMTAAGEHAGWPAFATCHVQLLSALGRDAEAVAYGRRYHAQALGAGLRMMAMSIETSLARSEAMVGEFGAATGRLERVLAYHRERESRGMALGLVHETRAWVAVRMGDRMGFAQHAEACAAEYRRGTENAALVRRYEALMHDARQAGLSVVPAMAGGGGDPEQSDMRSIEESVQEAFGQCSDQAQRAERALALLLESTGAKSGSLFLVHGPETRRVASTFDDSAADAQHQALQDELQEVAAELVAIELDEGSTAMLSSHAMGPRPGGRRDVRPVLLSCQLDGRLVVAGAATLMVEPGRYRAMRFSLIEAITRRLIEAGDVLRPTG